MVRGVYLVFKCVFFSLYKWLKILVKCKVKSYKEIGIFLKLCFVEFVFYDRLIVFLRKINDFIIKK